METLNFSSRLRSSAAIAICAAAAISATHGTARAGSICGSGSAGTFSCSYLNGSADLTAQGTFTDGAVLDPSAYAPLDISNTGDLSVSWAGDIQANGTAIALSTVGGTLTYSSSGTSSSSGDGINTVLAGDSIIANSGTISATGLNSWGLRASTDEGGPTCGTNTVKVTGNISASRVGLLAVSCGDGLVHVESGNTVSTFGASSTGATVGNLAVYGHATTIIDGAIRSQAPDRLGLVVYAGSSDIVIRNGGELMGTLRSTAPGTFNIESGGTWITGGNSDFSGGLDTLTNAGTIRVGSPVTTFTGLETLTNSGTIDLQNNFAGDTLSIPGDYVGNGGSLLVDVDGDAHDSLAIGGTASGTTYVYVNGVQTVSTTPLMFVQAGTMTDNAFVLGNSTLSPLLQFSMSLVGGRYFITAAPSAIAFQPMLVGQQVQDLWHQSADSFTAYAKLRRSDIGAGRETKIGLWAQPYGSSDRSGSTGAQTVFGSSVAFDSRVKTDRWGAQAGVDFLAGSVVLGLTGGYEKADAHLRTEAGQVKADGYNLGAYALVGGPSGLHADLLVKRDWSNVRLSNAAFAAITTNPDSTSNGVDGEVGYRQSFGDIGIDASAGLAHVRTKIHGFSTSAITYGFDRTKSTRGRLGVRGEFGTQLGLFADARLYHEFEHNNRVTLTSGALDDSVRVPGRGTWGQLEAGVSHAGKLGASLSGWVDVGDVRGVGLRAGLRF